LSFSELPNIANNFAEFDRAGESQWNKENRFTGWVSAYFEVFFC
jgi:hypothetical protein